MCVVPLTGFSPECRETHDLGTALSNIRLNQVDVVGPGPCKQAHHYPGQSTQDIRIERMSQCNQMVDVNLPTSLKTSKKKYALLAAENSGAKNCVPVTGSPSCAPATSSKFLARLLI